MNRNKDWHGYDLPANHQTDDTTCFIFRVPNEPEYITAFFSQFHLLKQWLTWEKDGTTRASEAAETWRGAEFKPICCRLWDCIDDEGNMCINIDVNCGCSGGSNVTVIFPNPDLPEVQQLPDLPPEDPPTTDPTTETSQELCNLGTYLVDSFDELWLWMDDNWEPIGASVDAVYTTLTTRWPIGGASIAVFSLFILGQLLALLTISALDDLISNVRNGLVEYRDDLICAIATAGNAAEAKSQWYSALAGIALNYGRLAHSILWLQSHLWSWDGLMAGEVNVPIDYDNSVCNCNGSPPSYDHEHTYNPGDNNPAPFVLGNGTQLHQFPFYGGDGHHGLQTAGANIASVTLTNDDWCGEFFIPDPELKIAKRVVIEASLTTDHGGQPPSGDLRVTMLPGTANEEVFDFPGILTDQYVEYEMLGNWDWDIGANEIIMKYENVNSQTFQAELKVRAITIGMDNKL